MTDQVHIAPYGLYITTPEISENTATILVKSNIENEGTTLSNIILETTVLSPDGRTVGKTQKALIIEANASKTDEQNFTIEKPVLWSVETPRLYKAVTEIKKEKKILDHFETTFGIRSIHLDATSGLLINGKRILLKGGCIHHDNGPLGAASIDRAEERKIEILKANGFNAIRTSHNPPSMQLLDACDRLGMLVIDEAFDAWEIPKMPDDYSLYFKAWWRQDVESMVLRDRNHPSVIIWSIGNEITERVDTSGLRITKQLVEKIRQYDHTRPVTEALCHYWEQVNQGKQWSATSKAFALLDIGGYNYQMSLYESDHEQYPGRIMAGTESFPLEALENWNLVEKHPYIIGDFVWTAFDYLGEASFGHSTYDQTENSQFFVGWPWYNSWCGDIDIIGNKKPQSYYRDVVWRNSPIAMAVHEPMPEGLIENTRSGGGPMNYKAGLGREQPRLPRPRGPHRGDGLARAQKERPQVVLLDHNLPDADGLDVLQSLQALDPRIRVVVITAYGDTSLAVRFIKSGAYDFLTKPYELEQLVHTVEAARRDSEAQLRLSLYRIREKRSGAAQRIVGESPAILEVLSVAEKVARSDATSVLLSGESGTGKELVAQAVHELSERTGAPFMDLNCSSFSESLLENELFGHEKGAYTDAAETKLGLVELTDGGTLFLDEVAEMPLLTQAKLLRFLDSRKFKRVGGTLDLDVNIRIVAASNKSLSEEIEAGRFREDLYYRLKVVSIHLPPSGRGGTTCCSWPSISWSSSARSSSASSTASPGGHGRAPRLFVAGQRARAQERHRARGAPGGRPRPGSAPFPRRTHARGTARAAGERPRAEPAGSRGPARAPRARVHRAQQIARRAPSRHLAAESSRSLEAARDAHGHFRGPRRLISLPNNLALSRIWTKQCN